MALWVVRNQYSFNVAHVSILLFICLYVRVATQHFNSGICVHISQVPCSKSWHDFDNFQYDCWPTKSNSFDASTVSCKGEENLIQIKQVIVIHIGLGLTWITPPNITVFLGETFNVSYKATTSARFYDNMADSEYFSNST